MNSSQGNPFGDEVTTSRPSPHWTEIMVQRGNSDPMTPQAGLNNLPSTHQPQLISTEHNGCTTQTQRNASLYTRTQQMG